LTIVAAWSLAKDKPASPTRKPGTINISPKEMPTVKHTIQTLTVLLASLGTIHAADAVSARQPNLIVVLADDLGYGDLGCYGHPSIRTPHLDRMAREGMRFTDFYSAAEVCTPSRAALLTGRYPIRSGMCHDRFRVLRRVSTGCLPADEVTLAELLKQQGYATGCIGKWHLGVWSNNPGGHPTRHGFDFYFGLPHSNDMDPAAEIPRGAPGRLDQDPKWWRAPLFRGTELIEQPADQTTLTRRYADEAVRFIHQHKDGPFFLYFPHTFPHVPLFASERFRGTSPRGLYGDVVEELDWSIGQVLDAVRTAGIADNTFVFFTSDNGPWLTQGLAGGSAGLLRDGKGSTWEGGLRVPGIAWWPDRVPAGSTCREVASTMDLFSTCASLGGGKPPSGRPIDGHDITPLLTATGTIERDAYFYYRGTQLFAARLGKWKVHYLTQSGYGAPKPTPHDPPLLFDLRADPGESFNVAAQHADVIEQIAAAVARHRAQLQPAATQLESVATQ
jgi:arylsulfatase A-like enzyme